MKSYAKLADKQVTNLLSSVKKSTKFLEDLVEAFITTRNERRNLLCELASFYEIEKGNLLRKVLPFSLLVDILSKLKLVSLRHYY